MEVADKNIFDAPVFNLVVLEQHLRSFTAVNEVQAVVNVKNLGGGMTPVSGKGGVASQYGYLKRH
jgi:hypothetical protein